MTPSRANASAPNAPCTLRSTPPIGARLDAMRSYQRTVTARRLLIRVRLTAPPSTPASGPASEPFPPAPVPVAEDGACGGEMEVSPDFGFPADAALPASGEVLAGFESLLGPSELTESHQARTEGGAALLHSEWFRALRVEADELAELTPTTRRRTDAIHDAFAALDAAIDADERGLAALTGTPSETDAASDSVHTNHALIAPELAHRDEALREATAQLTAQTDRVRLLAAHSDCVAEWRELHCALGRINGDMAKARGHVVLDRLAAASGPPAPASGLDRAQPPGALGPPGAMEAPRVTPKRIRLAADGEGTRVPPPKLLALDTGAGSPLPGWGVGAPCTKRLRLVC
jgi:hypothetical protein